MESLTACRRFQLTIKNEVIPQSSSELSLVQTVHFSLLLNASYIINTKDKILTMAPTAPSKSKKSSNVICILLSENISRGATYAPPFRFRRMTGKPSLTANRQMKIDLTFHIISISDNSAKVKGRKKEIKRSFNE